MSRPETCPYHSRAWGVRCDRPAGHDGACRSSGDVFAAGYIPDAAPPPPAPRDEAPGEVVLWRRKGVGRYYPWGEGEPHPDDRADYDRLIAIPAAVRERERAVIEAADRLLSAIDQTPVYGSHPINVGAVDRRENAQRALRDAMAALRGGEG